MAHQAGDAVHLIQQFLTVGSAALAGGNSSGSAPVFSYSAYATASATELFHIPATLANIKQTGPLIYILFSLVGASLGVWGMVRMKQALMIAKGNYNSFRWISGFCLLCICQILTCAGESIGPQATAVAISTLTFVTFSQFAGPLLLRENFNWRSIVNTVVLGLSITGVVVLGPQPVESITLTGDTTKWGVLVALMVLLSGLSLYAEWTKSPALPPWSDNDRDRKVTSTSRQKGSALCLLLCSSFITWFSKIMIKIVLAEGGLMTKGPEKCILAWLMVVLSISYSMLSTHLLNGAFTRWSLARLEPIFATNMIILMTLSGFWFLGDLGKVNVHNGFQMTLLIFSVVLLFVGLFLCMNDVA